MASKFDHQILDPAQARLRLRGDLVVTPYDSATFVIEDPLAGKFFLVGAPEWAFLTHIDGNCTISDAIGRAATQAPQGTALTEREGITVARWLVDQSLAKPVDSGFGGQSESSGASAPKAPFNPFTFRIATFNPDQLLSRIDAVLGWLWSQWFIALWACLAVTAIFKLIGHWGEWNAVPNQILDRDNWWRMGIVWCLLKLLHEFGHGLSCRHSGVPVRRAGLLLIFFAPVPFVDVSGSWRLASRGRRIFISSAGMYLEMLVAFAALLLWNPTSLELFDRVCVDIAVLAGFNTLAFNANPLMRFDGYYILADAVRIPNLAGESQRYLSNVCNFWLRGWDVPGVHGSAAHRTIVKTYAYASFGWRCLTFFGIALSLIARWSWWGAAVSLVVAWFWFGLKLPGKDPAKYSPTPSLKGLRRRKAAGLAIGIAAVILVAWVVAPAQISAPAVVEYAPLTVVRASADGFVTRVYTEAGAYVEAGTVLLELVNDDLLSNVKRVEVELEQSRLRSRAMLNKNDFAEQQRELATAESLEAQLKEFRSQSAGLQVRSPCRATIATHEINSLVGRFVKKGDVLVLLGTEDRKELLVSAPSTDEKTFVSQLGVAVSIRRPYGEQGSDLGRLSNVEPRLSETLLHHALGADSGGDVAVKLERGAGDELGKELPLSVTPRISAKVELDADTSAHLRAGQRMIVTLTGAYESRGSRMIKRWNEYLIEFAARNFAPTN